MNLAVSPKMINEVKIISKNIKVKKKSLIKNMMSGEIKELVTALKDSKPLLDKTAGKDKVIKISCSRVYEGANWMLDFKMKYKGIKGIVNRLKKQTFIDLSVLTESYAFRFKTSEEIKQDIPKIMETLSSAFKPNEATKLAKKQDKKFAKEVLKNL